jgi:hypothetical protein
MRRGTLKVAQAIVAGALVTAVVAACSEEPNVAPVSHGAEHGDGVALARDGIEDLLPVIKRLTQPYQDTLVAKAAGYNTSLTPCMVLAGVGGMGYHYGNLSLIDGVVQALKPEILVYEPLQNGGLQLVAVEFVVPYTAWTKPNPPAIAGVAFHKNDAFQLWVLHAWVHKNNPRGTLNDWNPNVSCQFATTSK